MARTPVRSELTGSSRALTSGAHRFIRDQHGCNLSGAPTPSHCTPSTTPWTYCAAGSGDGRCASATTVTPVSITLSGVTASFTPTGAPHTTVSTNTAVQLEVSTNSLSGYRVSLQVPSGSLTSVTPGGTAKIPVGSLGVRETGTSAFQALSAGGALVVHEQTAASAVGGDSVSTDSRVQVPFVPPGTYTGALDYVASAE